MNYDGKIWLQKRPILLRSFLSTLLDLSPEQEEDVPQIINCIEQLYSTRNKLLILPMSFRQNLLAYSLSGRKLIMNMIGKTRPAGSCSFMKKWLANQAEEEIKFPDGLVRCVFDNEQVVGKRHVVMADNNTVPVSVITSKAYLEIDPQSKIQCQPELKPEAWLFGEPDESQSKMIELALEETNDYFRASRNDLVAARLEYVTNTQNVTEEGEYKDEIDAVVGMRRQKELVKVCEDCEAPNNLSYRLCRNCKGRLKKPEVNLEGAEGNSRLDPYSHINVRRQPNKIKMRVGEPEMINPSGFEHITIILGNIGKRAGISKYNDAGSREWLFLVMVLFIPS